jgi:type II secretion system protein N
LQILLSIIVGAASLVFFVLLDFPLDAVVGHYMAGIETQTRGAYRVSYSRMQPSLIFDSVFDDFRLEQKNKDSYEEVFYAKSIEIGLSLFSLMSKTLNATFTAQLPRGTMSGHAVFSSESTVLDLDFSKVALDGIGVLKNALKRKDFTLSPKGVVDGEVYLSLGKTVAQTEAEFRVKIAGFQLTGININVQNSGFPVPDLVLSPRDSFALFEGSLDSGRLTLTNISVPGGDIELQLKGRMNLEQNGGFSRSNLRGRFALSEALFEKVPPLVIIKEYKTADGFFPLTIAGSSQKPEVRIGTFNLSDMFNLIPR